MEVMPWPRLSPDVVPLLAAISPLIGVASDLVAARTPPRILQVLVISNATVTVVLVGLAAAWQVANPGARTEPVSLAWRVTQNASSTQPVDLPQLVFESDALSVWPALLVAVAAWGALFQMDPEQASRRLLVRGLLVSESLLLASFFCTDAIAGLVCLDLALVPLYLMTGSWGNSDRRDAAFSWWLTLWIGTSLTLLGIVVLVVACPWMQSDFVPSRGPFVWGSSQIVLRIQALLARTETAWSVWNGVAPWVQGLLVLGLMFRLPVFPFQYGYRAALESAPGSVAVLIAAGLPAAALMTWLRLGQPLFVESSGLMAVIGVAAWLGAVQSAWSLFRADTVRSSVARLSCTLLGVVCLGLICGGHDGPRGAWLLVLVQSAAVTTGLLLAEAGAGPRAVPAARWFYAVWIVFPGLGAFVPLTLVLSGAAATTSVGLVGLIAVLLIVATSTLHLAVPRGTELSSANADLQEAQWGQTAGIIPVALLWAGFNLWPAVVLDGFDKNWFRMRPSESSAVDVGRPSVGYVADEGSDAVEPDVRGSLRGAG